MSDKLKELEAQRKKLDAEIKKERVRTNLQEAKDKGEIFGSVADLIKNAIEEQGLTKEPVIEENGELYLGSVCEDNKIITDHIGGIHTGEGEEKKIIGFQPFYDCPDCGIVKGSTRAEKYNTIEDLAGSSGIAYHCTICDVVVDDEVWEVS